MDDAMHKVEFLYILQGTEGFISRLNALDTHDSVYSCGTVTLFNPYRAANPTKFLGQIQVSLRRKSRLRMDTRRHA